MSETSVTAIISLSMAILAALAFCCDSATAALVSSPASGPTPLSDGIDATGSSTTRGTNWAYRVLSCDTPANTTNSAGNFFSAVQLAITNGADCAYAGPSAAAPGPCFSSPESVWAALKVQPEGSRAISLEGAGMYYLQQPDSRAWYYQDKLQYNGKNTTYDAPWADVWEAAITRRFDDWFAAYKALGASVDFILSDFEMGGDSYWYKMSHQPQDPSLPAGVLAQDVLMTDTRWPALRASLEAAGKPFNLSFANVSGMALWPSTDMRSQVFDTVVVTDMVASYLNRSVYQPIAKHFPGVKFSNFAHAHHTDAVTPPTAAPKWWPWALTSATSPVGTGSHVGTHQSHGFYGGSNNSVVLATFDTRDVHEVLGSPFASLVQSVATARDMVQAAPSVPVQPWLAPPGAVWGGTTSWLDGDGSPQFPSMWAENVLHLMLSTGATEALWWKPGAQRPFDIGVEFVGDVLDELRMALTDGADNCTAPKPAHGRDITHWDAAFVLSGASVDCGGSVTRTAVRFTPRCVAQSSATTSRCTQVADAGAHPPSFKIYSGLSFQPIQDTRARLFAPEKPVSLRGYWIVIEEAMQPLRPA